jgi:hypothetical protein
MALTNIGNTVKPVLSRAQKKALAAKDPDHKLKQMIWLYFFLLIFEGALRKWILPFLSGPLLIVRDPVALYILVLAQQRGLIKSEYAKWMIIIGFASLFTAMILGHGNLAVALYGARVLILHFPLIFIIGAVFTSEDVIKMGKATLLISIPMIILVGMQFYSPQSAYVNRGIGGNEAGAGFSGALGFFRPPGTFSFTNGNALFFGFLAPFVFYFWLYPKEINKFILIGSTIALLGSIPTSISRALFLSIVVTAVFAVIGVARKPAFLKRILGASVGIFILLAGLSQTSVFNQATEAFTARFDGANESEGGLQSVLLDRYLGGMLGAVGSSANQPFFGYGIGLGTNLGNQLIASSAVLPEGEWGRIIAEQGMILGIGSILIRLLFSFKMFTASYKRLAFGDLLPFILLSYFLLNIPQAQWKQPTSLGFSIMIGGLQLASLRKPKISKRIIPIKVAAVV